MNLFGSGHGSGIRPVPDPGRKAKAPKRATSLIKYSDEQVAHAKWLLLTKPVQEVVAQAGLPVDYVRQINAGLIRANVEPRRKE